MGKFKVGDRVEWLEKFKSSFYTLGKIYEIKAIEGDDIYVLTDDVDSARHTWSARTIRQNFLIVPPTLTIEAGKFYKTLDGRKIGPLIWGILCDGWIVETGDGSAWSKEGKARSLSLIRSDLVAEWVDELPVANDNAAQDKHKFEVGDLIRSLVDWCDTKIGDVLPVISLESHGVWATDRNGDRTFLEFDEIEPAPAPKAIVALIENGEPKPATRPKVHVYWDSATKEAERLALLYPGQEFGVFILAGSKIADTVTETVTRAVLRAA